MRAIGWWVSQDWWLLHGGARALARIGFPVVLILAITPRSALPQASPNGLAWRELGFLSVDEFQLGSVATWKILPQDFSIRPGTWGPPRPRFPRTESPEAYSAQVESLAATSLVRASLTWLGDVRWYGSKDFKNVYSSSVWASTAELDAAGNYNYGYSGAALVRGFVQRLHPGAPEYEIFYLQTEILLRAAGGAKILSLTADNLRRIAKTGNLTRSWENPMTYGLPTDPVGFEHQIGYFGNQAAKQADILSGIVAYESGLLSSAVVWRQSWRRQLGERLEEEQSRQARIKREAGEQERMKEQLNWNEQRREREERDREQRKRDTERRIQQERSQEGRDFRRSNDQWVPKICINDTCWPGHWKSQGDED